MSLKPAAWYALGAAAGALITALLAALALAWLLPPLAGLIALVAGGMP